MGEELLTKLHGVGFLRAVRLHVQMEGQRVLVVDAEVRDVVDGIRFADFA